MIDIYSPELCATKDKIFVTNSYKSTDGKIYVYDYNGNLLNRFGRKEKGPGEFSKLTDIPYSEDGYSICKIGDFIYFAAINENTIFKFKLEKMS